jgi:hypothetical protein
VGTISSFIAVYDLLDLALLTVVEPMAVIAIEWRCLLELVNPYVGQPRLIDSNISNPRPTLTVFNVFALFRVATTDWKQKSATGGVVKRK